jgi:hypothetical protein
VIRIYKYIAIGVIIAFTILSIIAYILPSTDDLSPYNTLWNGLSFFATRFQARIITFRDLHQIDPKTSSVFIIGLNKRLTDIDLELLVRFIHFGGIVIIADETLLGNVLIDNLGIDIAIDKGPIADNLYMYKSIYFPKAFVKVGKENLTLLLNYASYIRVSNSSKDCVAYTSFFSFIDLNIDGAKQIDEPYGPFCVVYMKKIIEGIVYVISDSSIFINSMIDLEDNAVFIQRLIKNRTVYIIYESESVSPYTLFREKILSMYALVFGTWLRYPIAIIAIYQIYRVVKVLKSRRTLRKPIIQGIQKLKINDLEDFIQRIGEEIE